MRRIFLIIIMAILGSVCIATMAFSKTAEENRLEQEAFVLDHDAQQSVGKHAIVQLLKKEFNVDESMINDLRKRKLGYGEIAVILALAQQMPGRITDENVNKILSIRQDAPTAGWALITDNLGLKLGATVSQVAGIRREVSEDIKKAQHKEYETGWEESHESSAGKWVRRDY